MTQTTKSTELVQKNDLINRNNSKNKNEQQQQKNAEQEESVYKNCYIILFKMSSFQKKNEVYKEREKNGPYTGKETVTRNCPWWGISDQTKTLNKPIQRTKEFTI